MNRPMYGILFQERVTRAIKEAEARAVISQRGQKKCTKRDMDYVLEKEFSAVPKKRGVKCIDKNNPGPASVQLPSYIGGKVPDSKKRTGPSFSFGSGSRFAATDNKVGPGPAQYNVFGLARKGKDTPFSVTLKSVPKARTVVPTPAPCDYYSEHSSKALAKTIHYSFGLRPHSQKGYLTPAPNMYLLPSVVGTSKESRIRSPPAFSLAGRLKILSVRL